MSLRPIGAYSTQLLPRSHHVHLSIDEFRICDRLQDRDSISFSIPSFVLLRWGGVSKGGQSVLPKRLSENGLFRENHPKKLTW